MTDVVELGQTRLDGLLKTRRDEALAAAAVSVLGSRNGKNLTVDQTAELDKRIADAAHYQRLLDGLGPLLRVVREPDVYRPGGPSFFRDLIAAKHYGDYEARQRLLRHAEACRSRSALETRSVGSSGFAGLTVPQYLVDLAAPTPRAGAPFLAVLDRLPIPPDGMSLIIPRFSGAAGSAAAPQTAENTTVTTTDPSGANVTLPVATVAGYVDVSLQAIERGGAVGDEFIARDLLEAVDTASDSQALNGTATNGEVRGLRNVSGIAVITWTDASPTGPEFVSRVARAAKDASDARRLPVDVVVMRTRRWFWLCGQADSATRPIVNLTTSPPTPDSPYVGTIAGLGVVVDDSLPGNLGAGTNEDAVVVARTADLVYLESPVQIDPLEIGDLPATRRVAEVSGAGTVTVTGYRYAAFTGERHSGAGIATIGGTGLVDPGAF